MLLFVELNILNNEEEEKIDIAFFCFIERSHVYILEKFQHLYMISCEKKNNSMNSVEPCSILLFHTPPPQALIMDVAW